MPDISPLAESDRIAVIGLGYVGLPLAVALAKNARAQVTGFDTDPERIAALSRGHDRTGEVLAADLATLGGLGISADALFARAARLGRVDVKRPKR